MTDINFMTLLWIFAILAVLHEIEEWNITDWLRDILISLKPITH